MSLSMVFAMLLLAGSNISAATSTPGDQDHVFMQQHLTTPGFAKVAYGLGTPLTTGGYGVAFDPANGDFFVVNANSTVTVVNESRWSDIATISVRAGEYAHIAIDPVHQLGFVNGGKSQLVTIFNATTFSVVSTLPSAGGEGLALDTERCWLIYADGPALTFYNYSSRTVVDNVSAPSPTYIALDPSAGIIGYLNDSATAFFMGETSRNSTTSLTFGSTSLTAISYDPVSNDFVIGGQNNVTLINADDLSEATNLELSAGENVIGIAILNGGADEALLWEYYGTGPGGGGVSLLPLDIATQTFLPSVEGNSQGWPASIAIDPETDVALGVDPVLPSSYPFLPELTGEYRVTFAESGLDPGTDWCLTYNSTITCSAYSAINFHEPPGKYSFSVGQVPGFTSTPDYGNVTVASENITQAISFSAAQNTYKLGFQESGLPSSTLWSVTLEGVAENSTASLISFAETNGTYSYTVGNVPGYKPSPSAGDVTISGGQQQVLIAFASTAIPPIVSVTITPPSASVPIGGTQVFNATPTCQGAPCPTYVVFTWSLSDSLGELNNTTGHEVTFTAGGSSGNLSIKVVATLNGVSVNHTVFITIPPNTPASPTLSPLDWELIIAAIAVVVVVMAVIILRKKGKKPAPQQNKSQAWEVPHE